MNIIYGILGAGGLATVSFLFLQFFGKKSDIKQAVHNITQKVRQDNISNIETTQQEVHKKIVNLENLSTESQTKIEEIKKDANTKIKNIISEDASMQELKEVENDLWNA